MKSKRQLKKQWSIKDKDARIGFWNPWSYSNERHEFCKSLRYDILGLGELQNTQAKKQFQGSTWICNQEAKEKDGKCVDPAAGVAILLSNRMAKKTMSKGWVGTRIMWARIEGPVCNLFIIVTYTTQRKSEPQCSRHNKEIKRTTKHIQ